MIVAQTVAGARAPLERSPQVKLACRMGYALLAAQLAVLLGFSIALYDHYDLTLDYAFYLQALSSIRHGQFDPFSSVFHYPIWQNTGEFVMWPLALVYFIFPHGIDLLVVEDLALVGAELIAWQWAVEVLEKARPPISTRWVATASVAMAVALVADPWAYQTIGFAVHTEPLATFFTLLAGRDLWRLRTRRMWWWVTAALACTALAGLYVAALGVSGLWSGGGRRRQGLVMAILGIGWLVALDLLLGHLGGVSVGHSFGYLLGKKASRSGSFDLLAAVFEHPIMVLDHLTSRWLYVVLYALPFGLVGIASRWALPTVLAVFLPSMLVDSTTYIRFLQSFQQWPALPFILVGTAMVVTKIYQRGTSRSLLLPSITSWSVATALLAAQALPGIPSYWLKVTPAAATTLGDLRAVIPRSAQVVISQGISGRFANRPKLEAFIDPPQTIDLTSSTVYFIFSSNQGAAEPTPAQTEKAVRLVSGLGAQMVLDRDGIEAFVWHPAHRRRIVLY